MATFESDAVDAALDTICAACREGRHPDCSDVPVAVNPAGFVLESAGYRDCRCVHDPRLTEASRLLESAGERLRAGDEREVSRLAFRLGALLGRRRVVNVGLRTKQRRTAP